MRGAHQPKGFMATVPYQPQNLVAEQADGNILLSWASSLGATGYQIQRSTDGVNFINWATVGSISQYEDVLPGVGIQYFYQVAAYSSTIPFAQATLTFTGQPTSGNTVSIANILLSAGTTFAIGGSDTATAVNLTAAINTLSSFSHIVSATLSGLVITITAANPGPEGNGLQLVNGLANVTATPFSNGSTTSISPYSSVTSMIAAPPSEMSLYELRLRAQQTADRVGSDFVVQSEWNAFLRLAMYELYDLLIDSYEDLFSDQYVFINTNGSIQNYPLPDGCSNYFGSTFPNQTIISLVFLGQPIPSDILYVYGVPLVAGTGFAIGATAALTAANLVTEINTNTSLTSIVTAALSGTTVTISPVIPGPASHGIEYNNALTNVTPQTNAPSQSNYPPNISPARAFYKLIGMDLNVNSSTTSPAWVTLRKYNFIDRNNFVYPNSTSTLYGVFNMGYRLMGKNVNIIPTPAGNQILRMWYAPKLPALLADTDLTTLGFSGWLRYPIVRAAKYALDKEEGSDTSKLDTEIIFLKQRIEQASQNRDAGIPDTISETRREGLYGGTGWGGGGSQGGW